MRRGIQMSKSKAAWAMAVAALLCAGLMGCTPGPAYHRPSVPTPAAPNYKESPVNFQDAEGWKVASPHDEMLHGNWWEVFQQPELNDLEQQLNINNQTIKVYFENISPRAPCSAKPARNIGPRLPPAPRGSAPGPLKSAKHV